MITNELTTRFTADNEPEMMPALGDSHTHRINFQITLGRDVNDSNLFAANIDKSFCCAEKSVTFWVNAMRMIDAKCIYNKEIFFRSMKMECDQSDRREQEIKSSK